MDDFNVAKSGPARTELLTVEQLERLQEQAHAEGYAAGYAIGAEQARGELARLQALMSGLDSELRRFDQGIADNLVDLALEMARQLVRNSLTQHPEQVVDVVREAMQTLPPFGEHAHLLLHPLDAALVRGHIGEQLTHSKWKLVEDHTIERGGCRVQTASMQVDGTLPTRWQRMVAGLARNEAWYRDPALEAAADGAPAP
jgi:flagellar assembly protein FliH